MRKFSSKTLKITDCVLQKKMVLEPRKFELKSHNQGKKPTLLQF